MKNDLLVESVARITHAEDRTHVGSVCKAKGRVMVPVLVRVLPGVERFDSTGVNDAWIGVVTFADGNCTTAFIKDIPPKAMANELVASALAGALGLSVPQPLLAIAGSDVIPAQKSWPIGAERILFATERKGAPPLGHIWTGREIPKKLAEAIAKNLNFGKIFTFDGWAANVDRNINNILFDGVDELWFIDHEQLLTGTHWVRDDLEPDGDFDNKMGVWYIQILSQRQRGILSESVKEMADAIEKLDIERIAKESKALSILSAGECEAMLHFLRARARCVEEIATRHACMTMA